LTTHRRQHYPFRRCKRFVGRLSLSSTPPGLDVSWNANLGILTISASDASPFDSVWQTALNNVRYQDALNDNPSATRAITVTASNGVNSFPTATETINITQVNDLPHVDIAATDYNAAAQAALNLKGTGISISDPDANIVEVDFSVSEGSIFIGGNLLGIQSIGNNSSFYVNGTVAAINALLGAGRTSTLTYLDNSGTPSGRRDADADNR
jgi:hypothetical protein